MASTTIFVIVSKRGEGWRVEVYVECSIESVLGLWINNSSIKLINEIYMLKVWLVFFCIDSDFLVAQSSSFIRVPFFGITGN